jgi:type IV protein arginine methyltransferase
MKNTPENKPWREWQSELTKEEVQILPDAILMENGRTIMHRWETPLMEKMAAFVCEDGGDVIEMGFGMGIAATAIQSHSPLSHTICEINPLILKRLYKWAEGRPNVIILEGDWYNNIDKMGIYDGIFFDTHDDGGAHKFYKTHKKIAKPGCRITWWNNLNWGYNELGLEGVEFEKITVNPPANDYFNFNEFWMPKHITPH